MVRTMKSHAAGFTLNADHGGGRLEFGSNQALTLAVFGTLFSSYPCSSTNPFNGGPSDSWARLNCGTWDDKWVLVKPPQSFFNRESYAQDWTALPRTGPKFKMISYVVSGNIDFAFTGRAWGIPQFFLENYAQLLPQGTAGTLAASNVPPQKTGYRLWDLVHQNWSNLTAPILDEAIHDDFGGYGTDVRPFSPAVIARN